VRSNQEVARTNQDEGRRTLALDYQHLTKEEAARVMKLEASGTPGDLRKAESIKRSAQARHTNRSMSGQPRVSKNHKHHHVGR
jgi:hypothetical protein